MQDIKKLVGARIAKLRKMRGLTQIQLAELLDVATSTVANLELGKRFLTPATTEKLAAVFEIECKELFDFGDTSDIELAYNESKRGLEYLYKTNPDLMRAVRNFISLLI